MTPIVFFIASIFANVSETREDFARIDQNPVNETPLVNQSLMGKEEIPFSASEDNVEMNQNPSLEETQKDPAALSSLGDQEAPPLSPPEERETQSCNTNSRSNLFWIRHTEPKGVGFNQGYTTLEGFVMSDKTYLGFFPYLDARWHIFNDGKNAANVGVGARRVSGKRFYGANVYYDYRKISNGSFNQVSFGFETIGRRYDFFANGYVVVGQKNTGTYGSQFYRFQGHHLLLKGKKQGTLSGLDGVFRVHLLQRQKWDCYVDAGPYYYHGSENALFGGKVGVGAILSSCFFAEGTVSYDHIFKWIGQGIAGLRFSFGSKANVNGISSSCKKSQVLSSRLMQIPKHNEIIVVNEGSSVEVAINPATDQPYFFWFVNNLSSSLGTFESPYPTLVQAQTPSSPYDIIYAYTGNGTTKGMDSGIVLKDFQQLWGAGISHPIPTTRGEIVIPALDTGYPKITNTTGAGVDLASFNVVSGVHVDRAFTFGIAGMGINQADIINNIVTNVNQAGGADRGGIHFEGPGMRGTYHIANNTVLASDPSLSMVGIFAIARDTDVCELDLLQNYVQTSLKNCAAITSLDSSQMTSSVNSNIFLNENQNGIYISHQDTSRHTFALGGNRSSSTNGSACFIEGKGFFSLGSGTISNSQFINSNIGLQITADTIEPVITCDVVSNIFANNANRHLQAETTGNNQEVICLKILRNTCTTTAPSGNFYLKNDFHNIFNLMEFSGNAPNAYVDGTLPGASPIFSLPFCGIPD